MTFEEGLTRRDLAPVGDLEETHDERADQPGEEDHDAGEDLERDTGTDFLHVSRKFQSECNESLAQFFPTGRHDRFPFKL